jgi:hypothetical protein
MVLEELKLRENVEGEMGRALFMKMGAKKIGVELSRLRAGSDLFDQGGNSIHDCSLRQFPPLVRGRRFACYMPEKGERRNRLIWGMMR